MNGFTAADMSTAAANGFRDGLAAQPGAAQEAVAWFTDDHLTDRSATTYDAAVAERWRAKGWPVTPLYAAPVAAVPEPSYLEYLDLQNHSLRRAIHAMMTKLVFLLDEDQFADIDAIALAAGVTPAAPGIDLEQFRPFVELERGFIANRIDRCDAIGTGERLTVLQAELANADRLLRLIDDSRLIDASPKGGIDACAWAGDGEGNWHTACGEIFTLMEGTPTDNKMRHCPYCGKNLRATSADVCVAVISASYEDTRSDARYFSADPAMGEFATHDTLREAIDGATSMLSDAASEALEGGWTDDPPQICYGVVLGECVEIEGSRKAAPEGSGFAEHVDFKLQATSAEVGA